MEKKRHPDEMQDEVLEILWTVLEQGGREDVPTDQLVVDGAQVDDSVLGGLEQAGLIRRAAADVRLTAAGFEEARKTIRRHRLSERLFADILDVVKEEMEDAACRFEHMLIKPELEGRICALLGHPKTCPHGRPIPIGECCHGVDSAADQTVVPMSQLLQGQGGVIAYVHSGDSDKLKKLMAMGILPGERVTLERQYPSFVFVVGNSRYAVDEGMANAIFVRRA